jgi:hypothetical protein
MKSGKLAPLACAALLGTTVFTARSQATTVYAETFSPTPHAGTMSDPWPGSAIVAAINSLPSTGGTVMVHNGVWNFTSDQTVLRGNFTLQGASLNAHLIFTTGSLIVGQYDADIANVTFSTLTLDASNLSTNEQAVQWVRCGGCNLTSSLIYGHTAAALAAFFVNGGSNITVSGNKFTSLAAGGGQLQINPLSETTNSGYLISNNEFDSVNLLIIAVNNIHVTENLMHNPTLASMVGILFSSNLAPTSTYLFDYNTIDTDIGDGGQGAIISGIPQDPGEAGKISNITIDHNTLSGSPVIAATYFDPGCVATCPAEDKTYNFRVTNNNLSSSWGSIIDVSGGDTGLVNGATISGNTFSPAPNNAITKDNHSYNVQIINNSLQ